MAKRELKKTNAEAEVTKTEIEEEPEVQQAPALKGTVTGCTKLNVRKSPNLKSDVVTQINAKTEVAILSDDNKEWYKVSLKAGVDGYCMKKYITLK